MALALGSIVALPRSVASVLTGFLGKKPLFGRLTNAAAPWDILWENGARATGIPSAQLDEITFAAVNPAVVRIEDSTGGTTSPYFDCIVLAQYSRSTAGAAVVGSFYLLKAVNFDQYYEVPPGNVEILEDR